MALKYTTQDAIARRLRGRLSIPETQPLSLGGKAVDLNLLTQIGEQVEAAIDNAIRKRYVTPLQFAHVELAAIAEKGVVCQLLGVHFVTPEMSEIAGYGKMVCTEYKHELGAIANGQTELQGEALLTAEGSVTARQTYVGHMGGKAKYRAENLKW